MKILKNLSNNNIKNKFNIIAKKSVILATPKTNNLLKNNYVLTDKEIIKSTGIDLSEYVNKEISYWTKDNEIIALSSVTSNNPTIKNVYFLDETNNDILCFIGGLESSYKKADNLEITNNKTKIATITFEDNKIKKINFTTEVKEEQIATITDNKVKTVKNEIFDIDPDYKVYYIKNNKIMLGKKEDLVEGKTYELYITDKKINAFVFTKL